jgi:hypothetical protein
VLTFAAKSGPLIRSNFREAKIALQFNKDKVLARYQILAETLLQKSEQ